MHKRNVRVLTMLVGSVLWLALTAQAQYAPHTLKVNVPFEFTVGDKVFPAGNYQVACTPLHVELRDAQGHVIATVIHHSVEASENPVATRLVFNTAGGGHELAQIWPQASGSGYELPRSKAAVELAKQRSNKNAHAGEAGSK